MQIIEVLKPFRLVLRAKYSSLLLIHESLVQKNSHVQLNNLPHVAL